MWKCQQIIVENFVETVENLFLMILTANILIIKDIF